MKKYHGTVLKVFTLTKNLKISFEGMFASEVFMLLLILNMMGRKLSLPIKQVT